MSVRRTVAQSSAGLLLLAAFAAGPTAVYADPVEPSEGGSGEPQCSQDASGQYETTLSVAPSTAAPGEAVSLTVHCYPAPGHVSATVTVTGPEGFNEGLGSITAPPGGTETLKFTLPEGAEPGDYSFVVKHDNFNNNASFKVVGSEDPEGGNGGEGEEETTPPPDEDEPADDGSNEGDESEEPDENVDDPNSGEGDQNQGGDGQDSSDDEVADGDDSNTGSNTGTDESSNGSDSDSENEQNQGAGNNDEADETEGSDREQPNGDTNASGTPTNTLPGDEQDGDTNASSAGENAAARKPAPQQPPAAPGSATNEFPGSAPEATADQKQSAALAVLMTKLFAGGVSSGSVGTTPDQARTVIDPSADASEIEVPAGSDTGGSSDDGSGSESSDGDALAATGSNMLVPAGIAAAAILLGAGLKIHQARRGL